MINRSGARRHSRLLVATTMFVASGAAAWMADPGTRAQVPAVKFDVRAATGLLASPVYEGWYELDRTKYALFGYSNRNVEEVVDVPVGPNNHIAPGPADQRQPTRFFPGRQYGVFAVAVPKDAPATEVTRTVTTGREGPRLPCGRHPVAGCRGCSKLAGVRLGRGQLQQPDTGGRAGKGRARR
jgi:hypothetical protein